MTGVAPLVLRLIALAMLVFMTSPLAAHSTPNSEVRLRLTEDAVTADIIVPEGEYAFGTGNPVDGSGQSLRSARDYLLGHISVSGPQGQPWNVSVHTIEFVRTEGGADLHAVAELAPPTGMSPRELTIDWRVLTDTLPGHFALFLLDDGREGDEGALLGAVRDGSSSLDIALSRPSLFDPLVSAITLGAHHILEGYDHLLFLLALLLPAPLVARSGLWAGHRPTGETLAQLAKIVTAFTLGHSVTLVVATLWQWSLPVAPVETAIAVSVLVSAMHAVRPILPGREPVVALSFGLVHGLAFATLVQKSHAGAASGALTLLGFNLGIEMVQLALVTVVVPSLLVLSRHPFYDGMRRTLAYACATAAIAWIVNRTTGLAAGLVASMEAAMGQMGWLALAASLIALGLTVRRRAAADDYVNRTIRT
ncbi:HupE/UreJ family protein [Qipengyuania sp. YG27]|uniref:HupE/UreJ family protein n=1 Tax=Qipengyuania mesophila TaxID=2867246 RepID=A0ABS7JVR5_9SPHN|nr:HupE/UreJ family protein [Qipengyuania mesophila]MBX7501687.1 HupE/UreJ family protein [Qipengyuania mesophila]